MELVIITPVVLGILAIQLIRLFAHWEIIDILREINDSIKNTKS